MRETAHRLLIAGTIFGWIFAVPFAGSGANKTSEDEPNTESYLFRYQFKKDEVLNYQVDHETTMITTKAQLVEKVTNEVNSRKNHRVVGLDSSGVATLELSIEETQMSAQFGEAEPVCFDSEKPKDCPKSYETIRDIVGKPLARVRVTPRGELLQTVPMLPHATLVKAKLVQTDGTFSDEAARNFLIEFPEQPLKVGENWTNTYKVNVQVNRYLKQPVTMQRIYEFVEVKDGLATIKLRTVLITPISDGKILAQLIQMTPSGTIVFDIENGRMMSRALTIDKTEVGVIGSDSAMQAKSKREERWIDPKAETKARS